MAGFIKLGEAVEMTPHDICDRDMVVISDEIIADFKKTAAELKKIAPKADDFLYFSCVMMHAAEASAINPDGSPKLTLSGDPVKVSWDTSKGTWRWETNDPSIKPYKNSNGDIFPAAELIKAHKLWRSRPLCLDHRSDSVDHVRGFIVDTYYDHKLHRVVALCALDKKNYPELARKVSTGYSNSVSMGTAVGRAICSDCGTVARTEADFCKCMKTRTRYGEINIDLNPIELSIVVNGADGLAKIKHIIASAQKVNNYFDQKNAELQKIASTFSGSLSIGKSDTTQPAANGNFNFSATDLEDFKNEIQKALDNIEELSKQVNDEKSLKDTNHLAFSQTDSTVDMPDTDLGNTDFSLAPPVQRYADESLLTELSSIKSTIENKFQQMQKDLSKLANYFNSKQEEIMSGSKDMSKKAYYQGGGGVNEPTLGETKYPVDPMQDELRESEDKQMVGKKPFPETGSDGLYGDDLEKKKMLARAEADERAMRRAAIVNKAKEALAADKVAYFQGGEEKPTPGKRQYPVDPMQDKLRDKEDKHMVGQKPFPDVGDVDGLHPSPASVKEKDELKRKEMLSRAAFKARFVKGADAASSAWQVLADDRLLLTASVHELSGGRSDALYNVIATKDFGQDLIGKVKAFGAEKTKALFKAAQEAPAPAPAPAPAAPEAAMPAPEAAPEDSGKEGDKQDSALSLAEKIRDLVSDLIDALRAMTGEQAEMGDLAGLSSKADDGKVSTAALQNMRKELNSALVTAFGDSIAALRTHEDELRTIASLYEEGKVNSTNEGLVDSVQESAVAEAKEAVADALKLLSAFVKYARGTEELVKRANEEALLDEQFGEPKMEHDLSDLEDLLKSSDAELDELMDAADDLEDDDADMNDAAVVVPDASTAAQVSKENPAAEVEVKKAFDTSTVEGRSALRAKLAADMKWNPMLYEAHPKGGATPEGLDTKPSDDLAHVETVDEVHEKMMDVVSAKVRKEAEAIQQLVAEGKLDPKDLPALVANGLDSEAAAYWKKYYGEVEGGSEFASELMKEHAKAEMEAEMATYRVKIARAYELAHEMVDRGLLANNRQAIASHVDEVMKWNDEAFESYKKVIAKQMPSMQKSANRMAQVGLVGETVVDTSQDLSSLLTQAFAGSKKRGF